MSATSHSKNPNNASSWRNEVENDPGIQKLPEELTLGDLISWNSGSSLTMQHFLYLKVLWKPYSATSFKLEDYVGNDAISKASTLAKTSLCSEFCKNTRDPTSSKKPHDEKSIFSLVKFYVDLVRGLDENDVDNNVEKVRVGPVLRSHTAVRSQVMAIPDSPSERGNKGKSRELLSTPQNFDTPAVSGDSPAQAKDFLARQDEIIVNTQILLLLNALTERKGGIREKGYHWLPDRAGFTINDNRDRSLLARTDPEERKLLQALVDGHLKDPNGESVALIEVKPCNRSAKMKQIQWQESAQMCAHICHILRKQASNRATQMSSDFGLLKCDAPERKRRLLISQDHMEVYINIGEYDKEYEQYLQGGVVHRQPKLVMPTRQAGQSQPGPSGTRIMRPVTPLPQTPTSSTRHPAASRDDLPSSPDLRVDSSSKPRVREAIEDMMKNLNMSGKKKGKGKTVTNETQLGSAKSVMGFLTMWSYGPWSVNDPQDLQNLCKTLIALSLYLSR